MQPLKAKSHEVDPRLKAGFVGTVDSPSPLRLFGQTEQEGDENLKVPTGKKRAHNGLREVFQAGLSIRKSVASEHSELATASTDRVL
jgi:hypothetical protein